ncbi:hypothetical protein PHMEG_00025855 [Phytophthora megakarya]|uniref:Retrotransposon gag domain-containing protein n=1 Tax=Phytophthora megakarya TaxID=4795 RepID=A0A225VAM8_9STRA|nr:hypothetical protein PHMEG_00025855 [Phytophthora megakarya]
MQVHLREPKLRKMDVKPPIFVSDTDGVKLNSFIFQFESYFRQKGYDLLRHDEFLSMELNQCVQKNALVWYERYLADEATTKLWSAMKLEMLVELMEPNFEEMIRNRLFTIKQTGGYIGYIGKFRGLNRIVQIDDRTEMNLFLYGLSDMEMKRAILRGKPNDLNSAIQEGFFEWELREKTSIAKKQDKNRSKGKSKSVNNTPSSQSNNSYPAARKSDNGGRGGGVAVKTAKNGGFCRRGPHQVEDCWFKHPVKHPNPSNLNKQILAMLEKMVVGTTKLTMAVSI